MVWKRNAAPQPKFQLGACQNDGQNPLLKSGETSFQLKVEKTRDDQSVEMSLLDEKLLCCLSVWKDPCWFVT